MRAFILVKHTGTDRLQPEDDGDFLVGAGADQVVRQQLASRQELIVPTLIDEDVQRRAGVRRCQHGGVVRLEDRKSAFYRKLAHKLVIKFVYILNFSEQFRKKWNWFSFTSHVDLSGPRYPEKAF